MAKNDKILLDGIIDDRVATRLPSDKRDEAFEYLVFEQILKDYDVSSDDIKYGSIDGRGDGGIDGFFVFVNGHLLDDIEDFSWPKTGSELVVYIISVKHHDTFRQATLDSIIATITEIFDFSIDEKALTGSYSKILLRMRSNLMHAYRKLSPRLANFSIKVAYASRGDTVAIGDEVKARSEQITGILKDYFSLSRSDFEFLGSYEIVALYRKIKNYSLELPFVEALTKGEKYIVLAKLTDYFKFISADGNLRRYLFESNVRAFMGLNRVNDDIRLTLEDPSSPDFWCLNNGVTILATSAVITGKSITASDIQIVNGLQTTESIFRHFHANESLNDDDRCVLVKVIVSNENSIRDSIIRATNNQTSVEMSSLRATDKIQRDIEETLLRSKLYYERRKNFYTDQGHSPSDLVTPLYVAAGYVALVLKTPYRATSLRSKFMRTPEAYDRVFDSNAPLAVWPKIAKILKRVDQELEILRPKAKTTDKFLKGWRYITSFLLVARSVGKFNYSTQELIDFDIEKIDKVSVQEIWNNFNKNNAGAGQLIFWSSIRFTLEACEKYSKIYKISGIESINSTLKFNSPNYARAVTKKELSNEFLESVRKSLPDQPWKPGVHRKIVSDLKCDISDYYAAVDQLMDSGVFLRQRDGVLYNQEGKVVSFDPERVDPITMELLPKTRNSASNKSDLDS